ncbi:YARHG domain-containing protein [Bacillus sp. OAE603]|uniref:YARHG domain-containing protein n=1 Tax=Gottfriedia sp. OAE603 TaxID=2663872 RepID=UPI0017894E04
MAKNKYISENSRADNRKLQRNVEGIWGQRYLSIFILIAGVIILGATAIFYVYPKIMTDGNTAKKNVSTEVAKVAKIDEKKEEASEKTSKQKAKKPANSQTKVIEKEPISKEYILPESNTMKLTDEVLGKLSTNELSLARNEIYARHGYIFKSSDLNKYFSTKSWYNPDPTYNGDLNEIEKYNINFIKSKEN